MQNRTFSFTSKIGPKTAQKGKNWISSQDPLKTDKTLISRWNPSFLGDVGLITVVSEFPFGHPKCHFFVPEYGTKWLKRPFWGYQKWHFGCPNQNSEITFIDLIPPQNPHRDTLVTRIGPRKVFFCHFTCFYILAIFYNFYNFFYKIDNFWQLLTTFDNYWQLLTTFDNFDNFDKCWQF